MAGGSRITKLKRKIFDEKTYICIFRHINIFCL